MTHIMASHKTNDWSIEADIDHNIFLTVKGGERLQLKSDDAESICLFIAGQTKGRMNAYMALGTAIADKQHADWKESEALIRLFPGLYQWKPTDPRPCLVCTDPTSPWPHSCERKPAPGDATFFPPNENVPIVNPSGDLGRSKSVCTCAIGQDCQRHPNRIEVKE